MSTIKHVSLLLVIVFLSSCAAFYRNVSPEKINYPPSLSKEKVEISYRYDVLRDAGNKKYPKKEVKKNIRVVAIKITNNSDTLINVTKDLEFYCGSTKVTLLSPEFTKQTIKQTWPAYGLYLIGCISLAPLDILVFGGIGAGNMAVAGGANKKLLLELTKNDIRNSTINKGESIIGLISFETLHSDPITVKCKF